MRPLTAVDYRWEQGMMASLRRASRGAPGRERVGRRLLHRAAVLAASLGLAGCSLWNPQVGGDIELPKLADNGIPFAGGVDRAIDGALQLDQEYFDAVGDQAKLKSTLALLAIPASAAALYFGITGDASREVITGLATGTAGLLGLGVFFESSERDKVYLAGSQALGCVILASSPLLVEQTDYQNFLALQIQADKETRGVYQAIAEVQAAAAQMRAVDLAQSPDLQSAQGEVTDANQLISDAAVVQSSADVFKNAIAGAQKDISAQVRRVRALVSLEVEKTEADVTSITQITSGLSSVAGHIATAPVKPAQSVAGIGTTTTGGGATLQSGPVVNGQQVDVLSYRQNLATALGNLARASANLRATTSALNEFLSARNEVARKVGSFSSCNLSASASAVQVNIASPQTIKAGDSKSFAISGGKPPYRAELAPATPDTVHIQLSTFDQQPSATVTVDPATKATGFSVMVSDASSGGPIQIDFVVAANPNATPDTTGKNANNPPAAPQLTAFEGGLSPTQVKIMQAGAGMASGDIDGKIGIKTHLAVSTYHTNKGVTDDTGVIDEKVYGELEAEANKNWAGIAPGLTCNFSGAANAYECVDLIKKDFDAVQAKVKPDPVGVGFDEPMRKAIKQWETDHGIAGGDGTLNLELVDKIIAP
jgi:hypothetical protein